MKLTEQEIRYIIKDVINEFFDPKEEWAEASTGETASTEEIEQTKEDEKKLKNLPSMPTNIESTVKKIMNNADLEKTLGQIRKNSVGAAHFVTQLMSHLNLTPQAYVQMMTQLTESSQSHIISTLNNCTKLIKNTRQYNEN